MPFHFKLDHSNVILTLQITFQRALSHMQPLTKAAAATDGVDGLCCCLPDPSQVPPYPQIPAAQLCYLSHTYQAALKPAKHEFPAIQA